MQERGFTLIELVLVIVVIGILSVFLIPRFIDLQTDAMRSANDGNFSAFRAAVTLAHSQWLATGENSTITIGSTTIAMSPRGWPGTAVMDVNRCQIIWNSILDNPPPTNTSFALGNDGYFVFALDSTCYYIYQRDVSPLRYIIYNTMNGNITTINP